jgi:hypothetical protein
MKLAVRMEHRWGARSPTHVPVMWKPTGRGITSAGILTNVSLSGGFMADLTHPLPTHIHVSLALASQQIVSVIPARVVRQSPAGSGIEWYAWAPAAITELLRSVAESRLDR